MVNVEKLSPLEKAVFEKLKEVVDPEFGFPIVDRGLLDEVKVEGDVATVKYHLTVPFCPPVFALQIGRDIKKKAKQVPGIARVEVILQEHIMADEINKELKKEE